MMLMHFVFSIDTVHFWAPSFKWVISLANIGKFGAILIFCVKIDIESRMFFQSNSRAFYRDPALFFLSKNIHKSFSIVFVKLNPVDMQRPVEKVSTGQQIAITATGILFTRLSLVVVPVNYNLASVNVFMAGTGMIQLYRKYAAGQLFDGIAPASTEEKKE